MFGWQSAIISGNKRSNLGRRKQINRSPCHNKSIKAR